MTEFHAAQQAAAQLSELLQDIDNGLTLLGALAEHDTWDHVAAAARSALRDARDHVEDAVYALDGGTLRPAGSDDDG